MAKKMLINVTEREIGALLFPNLELAIQQMENELCEAMEWEDDEKEELLRIGREEYGVDYGIEKTSAWANADDGDKNCDWSIFDITKPFVLISVVDREIAISEFNTLEEAQIAMLEDFKECPDWDAWEEDFKLGEETNEYGVHKTSAWANADDGDMDCDWSIIDIEKLEKIQKECEETS